MIPDADVILSRKLNLRLTDGSDVEIEARIGRPFEVPPARSGLPSEWRCAFEAIGPAGPITLLRNPQNNPQTASGFDSMSAVENAFHALALAFDVFGENVSLYGEPGWHGFRPQIVGFNHHMERYLKMRCEAEMDRIGQLLRNQETRADIRAQFGFRRPQNS